MLVRCATLDPPVTRIPTKLNAEVKYNAMNMIQYKELLICQFHLRVNTTNYITLDVERHAKGMSSMSYLINWGTNMRITENRGIVRFFALEAEKTTHVNRNSFKCDEKNQQELSNCMIKFIEFKLDCHLPWVLSSNISNQNIYLSVFLL